MKKTPFKLFISSSLLVIGMLTLGVSLVHAQSIDVSFGNEPFFNDLNLAPGESIARYIDVANLGTTTRQVIVRGTSTDACSDVCIGDKLSFEIHEATSTPFNDTVATFLNAGEIVLGTIAPGDVAHYDLTATLDLSTGNSYQGRSISFDLVIGFSTVDLSGDNGSGDTGDDSGSGGSGDGNSGGDSGEDGMGGSQENVILSQGGGGGGNGPIVISENLLITNEHISDINIANGTAVIVWNTNRPATSQVVFGNASEGPYSINITQQNFGYAHSTIENPNRTTTHIVIVAGLKSGEKYSYRVVSRENTSIPTLSQEHQFIFSENGLEIVSGSGSDGSGMGGSFESAIVPPGNDNRTPGLGNEGAYDTTTPIESDTNGNGEKFTVMGMTASGILGGLAAAPFALEQLPGWALWFIILIAIIIISYITRQYWQPYLVGDDLNSSKDIPKK